jgi:hypothetical protein
MKKPATEPSLSLCIAAYNQGSYVAAAVESCLAQTQAPCEIVVSDNWSTDQTAEVLERYRSDPRVRVVKPPQHLPIEKHHRFLASVANGTHVGLLSSDDAYAPDFVRVVMQTLRKYPETGLVATGNWQCDAEMRPCRIAGLSYPKQRLMPPLGYMHMVEGCAYTFSTGVWLADALRSIPEIPENAGVFLDWYYGLWVGAHYPIQYIRRPLLFRRFHGENASIIQEVRAACHSLMMVRHVLSLPGIPRELRDRLAPMELNTALSVLDRTVASGGNAEMESARHLAQSVVEQQRGSSQPAGGSGSRRRSGRELVRSLALGTVNWGMVMLFGRRPRYLVPEA